MPIYEQTYSSTRLLFREITESTDTLAYLAQCAGIDISSLSAIRSEARRAEKIVARMLIAHAFGIKAQLCYTDAGAPYIKDEDANISISHTTGIVVLAIDYNSRVGVDIEEISPRILRVREKFLSDEELILIPEDDLRMHTIAWTAKEALFKAIPENGIDFAQDLHLNFPIGKEFTASESRSDKARLYNLLTIDNNTDYITTIATEQNKK